MAYYVKLILSVMEYHAKLILPVMGYQEYHVKLLAAILCFASLTLHEYRSKRREVLSQAQRVRTACWGILAEGKMEPSSL